MKKIALFFKNRTVISIIGLIALSVVIWFIGPSIKFGESNSAPLGGETARLVFILLIALAWGISNLLAQKKNHKNNEEFVADLHENQLQNDNSKVQTQSSNEVMQIEKRFTEALSTLKRLKFSGKGANKALYELPWYIIIGPPGSGKTTALIKSSLDFPLAEQFGKGALQGVGGTRNCDWWFTNEAVLIDTAGRYTTQDSHRVVDSSAWEGFLNLLKKNRRRRPINGAIIAISLHDLLFQTEEERILHAKTIRMRIDELMGKLEIRFPIYLMFTKTDMVSGFSEYFEDLAKDEREQVWGISLPNAPHASDGPDFNFLNEEFSKLIERLYDRVLWRVQQETDVKRRTAIQGFPQQMENLKFIIDSFVTQTFVKNRYHFQPYLRGVYFTSGTQDGTSIDRLMTSVSANFGFARDAAQSALQQGKSFFLGRLFRDVIFPESELVGSNRRYETIFRWVQNVSYASIAAIGITLFVVWLGSITRHEMFMSEVSGYVAEFKAENKRLVTWKKDLRSVLPSLNVLAKASVVYDQEEHPWLSSMGLYDGNVDLAADNAYAEQLKTLLLPRLINELELFIKQGHRGGDLYNTFRTYMMFSKTEHLNKGMVVDWFKANWSKRLQGEATARKQLEQHLVNLLALDINKVKLNNSLVAQTRSLLLRVPVSKRVYSRIRTNPDYSQTVDLLNQFGMSVRAAYKVDNQTSRALTIPFLFTYEGYRTIDFSVDSPVISNIVNERWVLEDGKTARVDFIKEDLADISKKVKEHYLADYATTWRNVLSALDISGFSNLKQANDVLTNFTDPVYSPLLSVLQVSKENTQLTAPLLSNLAGDKLDGGKAKVSLLANKNFGNKVDRQFREINKLLRESDKQPAAIAGVILKIQQLRDFIGEVSLSPDPSKKSFDIAKARYANGGGNAITSLRLYAKSTPQPVKRWLISLADESWKVILKSAHQHINSEWKSKVHSAYVEGLAGRYPLRKSSSNELAIYDFSEFFKPKGTMDNFYIEFVKPFINTRRGWTNRVVDNYSLGLSKKTIAQIRKAQRIKNIFFRKNPETPSIRFQLKPYLLGKNNARFTLEVGDKRIVYNHGPKFWKTLTWNGADENTRARLIFEDLNEQLHIKVYEGNWAWFRLQDQSRLTKTRQSNTYFVNYSVPKKAQADGYKVAKNEHNITFQIKAKSVNNPFSSNLLRTFKCSERI
ncbi:IcmF-related protein [hydrothermal vent metagenome]|uniref:IcmF-related protein n=1 Tax=hydrothermal vent metagenome TaxID=652676 RepID=A0A3B0ZP96_9ZZZZ